MGTPLAGSGDIIASSLGCSVSNATVTLAAAGDAPAAPTGFLITNQGGSANTSTSTQEMQWNAVSGATGYNLYRNGSLYASDVSGTSYSDTDAPNSNAVTAYTPSTVYAYTVTAVNGSGESAPAYPNVYLYQNGVANQGELDYSYGLETLNWNATLSGRPCIEVDYSEGGGFQPCSNTPQSPEYELEIGAFNYFTVDIYLSAAPGTAIVLSHISRPGGTSDPSDIYQHATVNLVNADGTSSYGTPVIGGWATLKVPLSELSFGITEFEGYISGTTCYLSSLTSGPGPDGGAYITGSGVEAGTYVNAQPGSLSGPFTVNQSQTVGSSANPVALTATRIAIYKIDLYVNSDGVLVYYDNIGWTT